MYPLLLRCRGHLRSHYPGPSAIFLRLERCPECSIIQLLPQVTAQIASKRMTYFGSDVSFLMCDLFCFSSKIPFGPQIKTVLMVPVHCLTQTTPTTTPQHLFSMQVMKTALTEKLNWPGYTTSNPMIYLMEKRALP